MIRDPPYLNLWIRHCKKIFLHKKKAQLSRTGLGNVHGGRNVILTLKKPSHSPTGALEFLLLLPSSKTKFQQAYATAMRVCWNESTPRKVLKDSDQLWQGHILLSNVAGSCFSVVYLFQGLYLLSQLRWVQF